MSAYTAYNPLTGEPVLTGTTGTGLDQIVTTLATDPGLAGGTTGLSIAEGVAAADGLNALIVAAVEATGVGADGVFTEDDIYAINAWIRADPDRYATFVALHGDDEAGEETTGYHLVQNDGAATTYRGDNYANTVVDSLYHIGFEIVDGRFVNEDGNANASVTSMAEWLTQLWTDHSVTGTGFDAATDLITADQGLGGTIEDAQIAAGADAANGLNAIILGAIEALGLEADGRIDAADVMAISDYIRADPELYAEFVALHGDDEDGTETGFHLVQGDGANTQRFGENFVNTVADGIYHVGFGYEDGHLVNEDGAANASLAEVASWIDYFASDVSTTGTGLDFIADSIKADAGLVDDTAAAEVMDGARAADGLNGMILEGLTAIGALDDGVISYDEVYALNAWFQADDARYAEFVALHGDDETGTETGFHLVQGDGGTLTYQGDALIDTVADGLYHVGFDIVDGRFVNEDGNANATVADVATWLNSFVLGTSVIYATDDASVLHGANTDDSLVGRAGDDQLFGDAGADTLQGGGGADWLMGGAGADVLRGGAGSDHYAVDDAGDVVDEAADQDGDDGAVDYVDATISYALGEHLENLSLSGNDALSGTGNALDNVLWGNEAANTLDGAGGNDVLFGQGGADVLVGGDGSDWLVGGSGADVMRGGAGGDHYAVDDAGDVVDEAFGQAADDGAVDSVEASISYMLGAGLENLCLSGDAAIDGTGNGLDNTMFGNEAANALTGGDGNDVLFGNGGDDILIGGAGSDWMVGGAGADTFVLSGDAGMDFIRDFAAGEDHLEIDLGDGTSLDQLLAGADERGDGVILHLTADASVYLENARLADLGAANLVLS